MSAMSAFLLALIRAAVCSIARVLMLACDALSPTAPTPPTPPPPAPPPPVQPEPSPTPPSPPPPPVPPVVLPPGGESGGANDQLNLKQVTFLHTNVSEWPITSNITDVRITGEKVCVSHTKAGEFPQSQFGDIMVEGNVWIFARINGQWFGATWDWLRVGQTCKSVTASEFGADQIRIAPMDSSWVPRLGEEVGFMMSTRARDGVSAGQERTNVVLVTWPY